MRPTTSGRYRVFETGRSDEEWLFVEIGTYELGVLEGDGRDDAGDDGKEGSHADERDGVDERDGADAGSGEGPDPEDLFEPVYVPKSGHGDLDDAVAGLRPGYVVDATLEWDEGEPIVVDLSVRKRTLFEFVEDVTTVFQAAQETWVEAVRSSEPMNARITRSTGGEANGVLYVFADPPGATDVFGEFHSGTRPLEPLLARVNEANGDDGANRPETPGLAPDGSILLPGAGPDDGEVGDGEVDDRTDGDGGDGGSEEDLGPDREVFVIGPADDAFVIVYIVLRKGGVLADAVRDTYSRPAPDEPLA